MGSYWPMVLSQLSFVHCTLVGDVHFAQAYNRKSLFYLILILSYSLTNDESAFIYCLFMIRSFPKTNISSSNSV